jgi:putative SOS response-associated peptidase YedK
MCGRYIFPTQAEMERYWQLTNAQIRNPVTQRFNAAPTTIVPMLRATPDGSIELVVARWGLIPFWWKEPKPPQNTFNARSEEAGSKPMWRIPAAKARCLVPALGWYEWKESECVDAETGELKKTRRPYFIRKIDREPMAFAGLMSRRNVEGETAEFSCAILTRDAVGPVAQVHTRMPIALPKDAEAAWLSAELTDAALMIEFARDSALRDFMVHPVGTRANNAKREVEESAEPFENPA